MLHHRFFIFKMVKAGNQKTIYENTSRLANHESAANRLDLARQLLNRSNTRETPSQGILRPLPDRVNTQLFTRLVPVRNRKRHSCLSHKVHSISKVRRDPSRSLAALLHLNT